MSTTRTHLTPKEIAYSIVSATSADELLKATRLLDKTRRTCDLTVAAFLVSHLTEFLSLYTKSVESPTFTEAKEVANHLFDFIIEVYELVKRNAANRSSTSCH